jgi:hypothetical protein
VVRASGNSRHIEAAHMPERGLAGLVGLVRDLYRELTPAVRVGLFAGLAVGLVAGLVYVLRLPPDYGRLVAGNRVQWRTVAAPRIALVAGLTLAGAFLGTAAGAALELAVNGKDGPREKRHRRRGRGERDVYPEP